MTGCHSGRRLHRGFRERSLLEFVRKGNATAISRRKFRNSVRYRAGTRATRLLDQSAETKKRVAAAQFYLTRRIITVALIMCSAPTRVLLQK